MNEEMYQRLYAIIESRASDCAYDANVKSAYRSCLWLLEYAHNEDVNALKNYDYNNAMASVMLKQMFKKE